MHGELLLRKHCKHGVRELRNLLFQVKTAVVSHPEGMWPQLLIVALSLSLADSFGGHLLAQVSITSGVLGKDARFHLQKPSPAQLDSLRKAARSGNTAAQMALVEYFQLIELKPDSARFYLQAAVRAGLPEAQYLLGLSYLRGVEGPKRPIEGKKLLEAAAKQNHLLSIRVLYQVLEPPDSASPLHVPVLPYNAREAFGFALQGAQLGDPPSMTAIGRYYAQGKGTPRNDSLSELWLRKAAEMGHIPAQVLLAEWYLEKWNKPAQALYWAQQVIQNERSSLEEQYRARVAAYHAEHLPKWLSWLKQWIATPPLPPRQSPP